MANLTRKLSNNNPSSQNYSDTTQNTESNNTGDKSKVKDKKSKPKLIRRHSITICESRSRTNRKLSASPISQNCDQQKSGQLQSGPFSMMPIMDTGMKRERLFTYLVFAIF